MPKGDHDEKEFENKRKRIGTESKHQLDAVSLIFKAAAHLNENNEDRALSSNKNQARRHGANFVCLMLLELLAGDLSCRPSNRPAELPELLDALLHASEEDKRIIANAQDLANAISNQSAGSEDQGVGRLRTLLNDDTTRAALSEQLPGVAALGRRVGAGLLRRAAYRTEQSKVLPERARKALSETNEALAKAIDYDE
jgi:hypothetical protein